MSHIYKDSFPGGQSDDAVVSSLKHFHTTD